MLRLLLWLLGGLALALALAVGAFWVWAGSDGSLATVLRWVGAVQPLVTEEVSGNLRSSGKVRKLVWQQGGLRVEVEDAELHWSPAALLARTLQIDRLSASRIVIDDRRPKSTEPSSGPPTSIAVPLKLQVRELVASELRWAGPPPYSMADIAGRFDYDGTRHLLELDSARVEGGQYRARAAITAHAPVSLDVALAGALTAPVPGTREPMPLTLQASLRGPLTELRAQADLQADPAARGASAPTVPALPAPGHQAPAAAASAPRTAGTAEPELPEAHATARITPWGAQPLPEASARVRALDVGAIWAEAPRTLLTGQFELAPLPEGGAPGWTVQADITNARPGPWDRRQLPLRSLQADATWQDRVATVRALKARVGEALIESNGRWVAPPAAGASAPAGAGDWRIDTRIDGLNPAELHTQLAAFPIDGTAKVSGAGTAIDFDTALQARAQRASTPARTGDAASQAVARDLRALRLRDLSASGRWHEGLLTLERLRLRTDDAELAGQARVRPAGPGGSADLSFTAPGATLALKGELQPDSGAGTLRADLADTARLLAWLQTLPGADTALAGARASGRVGLDGSWRGGWRDPSVQARLTAPSLDVQPPGAAAGAAPIQLRELLLTASGKLSQAQLALNGRLRQGERQIDLRLAASGGRSTPQATLAQSAWRANISQLQAGLRDPALGAGEWRLASRNPVPLSWTPQNGGQFEAGAGELTLNSPPPASQTEIAWGPARWQGGELSTTGRLTGLPLQWVERVTGSRLSDAGLSGNIVFNGDWDAQLGREMRVKANLARASGDLTVLRTDPATDLQTRVNAGLREARVTLQSQGQALNLQLKWDSANAGNIDGSVRTELSAARDAQGRAQWSWPETAPLQGQVKASLPQLSVWSVLAPPGWRLRGALQADTRISGTRAAPLVNGTLSADDLALRSVVDGFEFADGRLRARLDGTRLVIDEFVLHGAGDKGAGGELRATGEAGWIDGRTQARLSATLDKLRASMRADLQMTVSGQVQAALDGRAVSADGRLQVDRARIVLPDDTAPSLGSDVVVRGAGGRQGSGKDAPAQATRNQAKPDAAKAPESPMTVAVNVQIDLGKDFRLSGMGIDTRLDGALTLAAKGPISTPPRLTGTIRTVDGTFRAYGKQLVIERGNVVFTGDPANPTLDIIALRPNYSSDQRVGAQIQGSALLPRVRLYSQPTLPDTEALAWLLLGRAAPTSGADAAMLQSAAMALLGGRDGRTLASRFGLDELSFAGGGGSDGAVAGAGLTLGKRLSNRLYAAYEHSLSAATGSLMIYYELSRRWTLRGQAGLNSAVDLIYKLSFD